MPIRIEPGLDDFPHKSTLIVTFARDSDDNYGQTPIGEKVSGQKIGVWGSRAFRRAQ